MSLKIVRALAVRMQNLLKEIEDNGEAPTATALHRSTCIGHSLHLQTAEVARLQYATETLNSGASSHDLSL